LTIYCGDAVQWAKDYRGALHHALLCDCPYHLASIVKRFGGKDAAPAQEGTDGAFRRMSKGFMNCDWDGVDEDGNGVAMKPETWAAFARVLHPGAFLLVFAGCLNDDAISMAMREAGLIKHHSLHWLFASGFPKATRIDTAIDRAAGAKQLPEREWTGGKRTGGIVGTGSGTQTRTITSAATDAARVWSGHRYGRQSLKPAVETILLFQKPYDGRPVDCITRTGAGALNIDGGRIGGLPAWERDGYMNDIRGGNFIQPENRRNTDGPDSRSGSELGRWPANFIVGSPEAAAMLDRQSGQSTSGQNRAERGSGGIWDAGTGVPCGPQYGDTGGVSRHFFNVQAAIDDADPVIYCAKSGRVERNSGLDHLPETSFMRYGEKAQGPLPQQTPSVPTMQRNVHPTVKPLSLTRHLASLLLPPKEYEPRRIFIPFAGVASECVGADLAGFEEVSAVELSAEYCRIGEARRRFWACNAGLFEEITAPPPPPPAAAGDHLFTTNEGDAR
jgi:hypothetical protein